MSRVHIGKKDDRAAIGVGAVGMGLNQILDLFRQATQADTYALPTVAKVQWEMAGPMSSANVQSVLGDVIDILGSGTNPPGVDEVYQTPGLEGGEFQTYVLACALGVHLEASPFCFAARGNTFTRPTGGASIAKPFSPDAWTVNDQTRAWAGTTGAPTPVSKAALVYGESALEGFWALVRGYNLRWTYGSHINILDEQLRETAYMPPNGQDGSASSSLNSIERYVREVNTRYATILGSATDFATIDTIRVGSVGSGTANIGQFTPSNDFQYVGITYGGSDLRAKVGIGNNDEFRTLTNPRLLRPGVKIGLKFEAQNTELATYFRAQFDAMQGLTGTVPPVFTDSLDFAVGAGTSFQERTIDGFSVLQTLIAQESFFKGFRALMSNEIKGWEIAESIAAAIQNDPTLAAKICSDCGCMVGWSS
jgi:hypothetical protein